MPEMISSMEQYSLFAKERARSGRKPERGDLEQLLSLMRQELTVSASSPLMDAAYRICRRFCAERRIPPLRYEPVFFAVRDCGKHAALPSFDAWWLTVLLADYLSAGQLPEEAGGLLPYFFANYAPKNVTTATLVQALHRIDLQLRAQRKQAWALYVSAPAEAPAVREERPVPEVPLEAVQTEARRQEILREAQAEAEKILRQADLAARKKTAAAEKRAADALAGSCAEADAIRQERFNLGFSEVRSALLQTNELMRKLEDAVTEEAVKKASSQLLELYNLIADVRDSAFAQARATGSADLENTAYNMDVFCDMLSADLADYGIRPLCSSPGELFNAKFHAVNGPCGDDFDPRAAVVKTSIRTGFIWSEQILQKEQVEIERRCG